MNKITVGSLFAGVGGVCLGFKQVGCKLSFANEFDPFASETYRTNFSHPLIEGDIEKVLNPELVLSDNGLTKETLSPQDMDIATEYTSYLDKKSILLKDEVDILTAGFPCQPFSIAGNREGFNDQRGNLFLSVIDYINKAPEKPPVIFLENVKNLKGHDNGNTYQTIKDFLHAEGYTIKDTVLNTTKYSKIPHNRERIFVVCFLDPKQAEKFTLFDELEKHIIQKDKKELIREIDSIIEDVTEHRYLYTKEKYPNYFLTEKDYFNKDESKRKSIRVNIDEQITEEKEFYQIRRGMYIRKNASGVCPTLTANMGTGGHNVPLIKVGNVVRKLTERECFKLQGFPLDEGYKFPETFNGRPYPKTKLYQQAGNSVTVDVIKFIATHLVATFEQKEN